MSETNEELLARWNTETDFAVRNVILRKMTEKGLFPQGFEDKIEEDYGLYPNLPDPKAALYNQRFLQKLLRKQEFIEDRQEGIDDKFDEDDTEKDLLQLLMSDASACGEYKEGKGEQENGSMTPFELSPTQRFIGRFLSPQTPYNSALLYHGVGVGKTCSGITVAERFLEMFPRKQVFIIAPPTIQAGWLREIFSLRKLVIGNKPGIRNVYNGCTGNTYLRLSGTEFERDPKIILRKVSAIVKSRYRIMGYLQFYNYVIKYLNRNISKDVKGDIRCYEERRFLSEKFSGGMLIVDEAHNLRNIEVDVCEKVISGEKKTAVTTVKNTPVPLARAAEPVAEPAPEPVPEPAPEPVVEPVAEPVAEPVPEPAPEPTPTPAPEPVSANSSSQDSNNNENDIDVVEVMEGGANNNNDIEVLSVESDNDDDDEDAAPVQTTTEDFVPEEKDTPASPEDKQDILKGKKVTPLLRRLLQAADGMKFLMLTATPMYNDYKEIILLLNLLLLNDKKALIRESDIFTEEGFAPGGKELLGRIAGSYISFMRGENPLAFPIRLDPQVEANYRLAAWPTFDPMTKEIPQEQRTQVINLPYVACEIDDEVKDNFQEYCDSVIQEEGFTIPVTDKLIMAGNFLYPVESDEFGDKVGKRGFDATFVRETGPVRFQVRQNIEAAWMLVDYEDTALLEYYSPKANFLVKRLATTKGVSFVYSRFVETGALTIALILEANGYTNISRKTPLLTLTEKLDDKGRQCAFCSQREKGHKDHDFEPKGFSPAYYVLLTGEKDYSPNNKAAIDLATDSDNFDGSKVKVILGSTIASEGIDLKFIRELFVFDSWYHLSKLEQVIGRGIRYKSHCLLPPLQRNCTINLLVLSYGETNDMETMDMYQYRRGFAKALQVGRVTRILKENALDCNLNKELILIQDLNPIRQIDGQGVERRDVDVNDSPYTNICDWMETCDYTCKPDIDLDTVEIDYSTYDEYAAKWREHSIKKVLRKLFEIQPWRHFDDLQNKILEEIPRAAKAALLEDIVGNPSFRIRVRDHEGYIVYKNGYYLFQPEELWDTNLPLALRVQDFPVKRDNYEPRKDFGKPIAEVVEEEVVEAPAALSQTQSFWDLVVKWSKTIADGTANGTVPKEINNLLHSRYIKLGTTMVDAVQAIFEMVGRMAKTVKTNEAVRRKFAEVLLEFVWDEYFSNEEIQNLYETSRETPEFQIAAKENLKTFGAIQAFRFLNPKGNTLIYICNGEPCAASVIQGIEDADPISRLVADKTTTGQLYGLNVAKDGKILFKSNDAVKVGDKPATGRLCYTVANMKDKYVMLNNIAEIALTHPQIGGDLDLSTAKTVGIKTPARVCTLADIGLRLLDKTSPDGKRYFYRPISALKSKHTQKK